MTAIRRWAKDPALLVVFALFVTLGLPEGVLGTAWPDMRVSFERPVSSLAWLVTAYTCGYLVSAPAAGHLHARFGLARSFQVGAVLTIAGLAFTGLAPAWLVAVAATFVAGLGAGTVDVTANAWCALQRNARAMNLLHGFFGIGATLGPILVTAVLDLGGGWRSVYFGVVGLEALIMVALFRQIEEYDVDPQAELTSHGKPAGGAGAGVAVAVDAEPMPVASLLGMLGVFFFYVAAEAGYGHWTYSVLTEERGVSDGLAGTAVAAYWGGLTAGRMLLGVLGDRVRPTQLVRWSLASVVVGAAVFWLDPVPGLDLVSLLWLGMSMAGVFPAMVLLTPSWVGSAHTSRAVGYQLGAASVGVILSSQAVGALVRAYGLDAVPLTLAAITCATLLMFLVAERLRVSTEVSMALEGNLDESSR